MVTITLDDRDREILDRLRDGPADVEAVAESTSSGRDSIRDRLPELADNGLVRRVEDGYALTADGERTLVGSPAGTLDDRVDTPAPVEDAIRSFDLRADRADAVRAAYAFLAYWGAASGSEIVDAVYSEAPAGYDSGEAWWTDCVRDHLAALPTVDPPADSPADPSASSDDRWRFTGTADVAGGDDGRVVAGDDVRSRSSVRAALAESALDEAERSAVRAAFAVLLADGEATAAEIRDRAFPDHDAGYDSGEAWWTDCVRDELARLPGVERRRGNGWTYRQVTAGPGSSAPDATDDADATGGGDPTGDDDPTGGDDPTKGGNSTDPRDRTGE